MSLPRWRPTPEKELIRAFMVFDGSVKEIKDLVPGDVFRMQARDGTFVHPETNEPDPDVVCKAHDYPLRDEVGGPFCFRGSGYVVPVMTYATIEDLNKEGLS